MINNNDSYVVEILSAWQPYIDSIVENWTHVIQDITPKSTGCGPVYELENRVRFDSEQFARLSPS